MFEEAYTPKEYAKAFYYDKVTSQTVRNWVRKWMERGGMPENHSIKMTHGGHFLIVISSKPQENQNQLLDLLVKNR